MRSGRATRIALRVALSLLLVGTLFGTFGIAAYFTMRAAISVPEILVPDVQTLDGSAAMRQLEALGLRVEIAGRRHDDRFPEGTVLEQFPEPGHSTKAGRTVKLIVSKGARTAVVPDMAGSSQRRAQLAVRASKLEIRETASVNHPRVPLGRVVAQDPPPGAERFPGDPVSLLLSAGPSHRAYVMPPLTGMTVADARRLLEKAGFTRVRVRCPECEGEDRRSRIHDQRPVPGERVTTDDRVVISAGPWSMEITR